MAKLMPDGLTWAWIRATARVSALTISSIGIPCTLSNGNLLHLTNHTFRIDAACTGGEWIAMYALAVVLMPIRRERKWQGLLMGLPLLVGFNLFRLVLVAAVSTWAPTEFTFVHNTVMQSAFVLVAALLWTIWMWLARNDWLPDWEV